MARWLGRLLITFIWLFMIGVAILMTVELGGIARLYNDAASRNSWVELYRTDYYGVPSTVDPYAAFKVQHLNPFHVFSLPWQAGDIQAANNDVVSLDAAGYRINPEKPDAPRRGVLLGGSAVFGQGSSSNSHTIAARLSALGDIHWVNRNAPSWNSFQELTSLARYREAYNVSLSFTLMNDVTVFCRNNLSGALYPPDAPDSFDLLAAQINDIRSSSGRGRSWLSLDDSFRRWFPEIAASYDLATNRVLSNRAKAKRNFHCSNAPLVAETFVHNQTIIRRLSESIGARHIVIIQPLYGMHQTSQPALQQYVPGEYAFRREVIELVMASDLCRRDCYDLSHVFDELGGASTVLENIGTHYQPRYFVDEIHLTDQGVEAVAERLLEILRSPPP